MDDRTIEFHKIAVGTKFVSGGSQWQKIAWNKAMSVLNCSYWHGIRPSMHVRVIKDPPLPRLLSDDGGVVGPAIGADEDGVLVGTLSPD